MRASPASKTRSLAPAVFVLAWGSAGAFAGGCSACGKESASLDAGPKTAPITTAAQGDGTRDGDVASRVEGGRPVMSEDDASAHAPMTAEEKKKFASYGAALAEGRKATREKRYEAAEAAFTRALELRPDDARALGERGYSRLLEGALDKAGDDFDRALAKGVEPKLASMVFFNVGLLREKKNEAEGSRAAFAIANAIAPSAAAKAKLAGRSACTADINTAPAEGLSFAADFTALSDAIGPAKDLGSPKASVCVATHTAMGDPSERDLCNGAPPWTLFHHHLSFTEDEYIVVPKKGVGLFYLQERIGGWPAHCTNLPFHEATLDGSFLHVKTTFDGLMAGVDDSKTAEGDGWQMPCVDVLGYEAHAFYDTVTGKRLARVFVPSGVPSPEITSAGAKITLRGAGCDRVIDLAATIPAK